MSGTQRNVESPFSMAGKVVIVTGSTRGIGLAAARMITEAGGRVAISSRKPEACESVVESMTAAGHDAVSIPAHAGRDEDLKRLVETTVAHFGRLDAVVANAGINPVFDPLIEVTEESWSRIMETNVSGPLRLARHALPHIAVAGGGAMVMVSSVNAQFGFLGSGPYGISKAALEQMTRQLAVEWGSRGIAVNAVAPGTVRTDMVRALIARPGFMDAVIRSTPLGRIAEPEDVGAAIVFLLSGAGRHITGQVLTIDGGQSIRRGADA
jgi:NAD(P)-dependent dehydrogenase (short-subunit alcohol dehydrogenase family)